MTTAIATIPAPAFAIDLAKADRKQLRFLGSERDKERVLELVKQGIDIAKPIITHEVTMMLGGFIVGNYLIKKELISEYEGNYLGWAILGICLARAGTITDLGDAISNIKGVL